MHKRCCLADDERLARETRFDDAVGRRIQDWSAKVFDDEITAALDDYVGPERVMDDADIQIFATWFHNDRELAGGGTPAQRYAARHDLRDAERDAAVRIAMARIGLALALMRFIPASRSAEPSFFTLEGDPIAFASATWAVRDPGAAAERLRWLAGLGPDDPPELDTTAQRATLVEQRPPLPPGALVFETSSAGAIDTVSIATLRLEHGELHGEAMSERRLTQMLEIVASDFGELVELRHREVRSVDETLAAHRAGRSHTMPDRVDPAELLLAGAFANKRMRRWLDEPHQSLGGRTPREAAAGADRAEVVRLLRQIENGAERARRRGEPGVDVAGLRGELGLGDDLAA